MRIDPGGGVSIGPVAHNQPIDQTKVTVAVRQAEMTVPLSGSNLAHMLTNADLNQAERDPVIQALARQPDQCASEPGPAPPGHPGPRPPARPAYGVLRKRRVPHARQ